MSSPSQCEEGRQDTADTSEAAAADPSAAADVAATAASPAASAAAAAEEGGALLLQVLEIGSSSALGQVQQLVLQSESSKPYNQQLFDKIAA
ncbi:uncharacterized protein EMH_0100060 [Eimeria mitis]|uniref:Uncharacterized protein n=1 Tax=Eimeria mitis TaxID=44415 RepID=U6JT29_9EIME|nr:uncharacterized protein EMH_0100060 [Eimeria mitis]CDJ27207.1 hypothetical protein EMH_0100060 [Eimeria mitis]